MKFLLLIAPVLFGLWALPAHAQVTPGGGCGTAQNPCYTQGGGSGTVPIPTIPGALTPLGQQTISSATLATAQSLTIPTGATVADFYPEGIGGTNNQCVRYRDDGTDPTASVGSPLQPGQLLLGYASKPAGAALSSIKFIAATGATCTLTINYYK